MPGREVTLSSRSLNDRGSPFSSPEKNERIYRGRKCRSGSSRIRREDCEIQAGDKVLFDGKIRIVKGSHRKGEKYNIEFKPDGLKPKSAYLEKITPLHRKGGWGVSSHE